VESRKFSVQRENVLMMQLIVRRWKTPNHSNDKSKDDSHSVKEEILKAVRERDRRLNKKDFSHAVGKNPDLDIVDNIIVLKGRGTKFRGRPYYKTGIPVEDHFVLRFMPAENNGQLEILFGVLSYQEEKSEHAFVSDLHFDKIFILPDDDTIISLTVRKIIDDILVQPLVKMEDVIVVIK
jgi:hypothetical protein